MQLYGDDLDNFARCAEPQKFELEGKFAHWACLEMKAADMDCGGDGEPAMWDFSFGKPIGPVPSQHLVRHSEGRLFGIGSARRLTVAVACPM